MSTLPRGTSGIYCIRNLVNAKIYIGSSQNIAYRWRLHRHHLDKNTHDSRHLQAAWNHYGLENFAFEILETCDVDYLIPREQYWIDLYKAAQQEFGYNILPIAGSTRGRKLTDEQKRRISQWMRGRPAPMKGRKLTPEHRQKLSEAHKGKSPGKGRPMPEHVKRILAASHKTMTGPLSEEHKRKIAIAKTGYKFSEEAKRKMSDAHKGKPLKTKRKPYSAEVRQQMSDRKKGTKLSAAHRQKLIDTNTGRPCSEETRRKISEAQKGKKRPPLSPEHRQKLCEAQRRRWDLWHQTHP